MTTQAVSGRRYFTKAWLLEQKSLIALLVLIAIVSTLSPNFFTVNNLFNILQQTSVNAIMAVGMTLVILTSGIDLSVGSLLALTGAVAASIVGVEVNALVAVAAALALGAAIGAVTGVIVAKGRVQAFIATLVMMLLLRGVTMVYTDGSPVNTGFTDNADLFGWFGIGRPLGVPTPVWIMAIVFIAAWYMLHHTRLGRYIYAQGWLFRKAMRSPAILNLAAALTPCRRYSPINSDRKRFLPETMRWLSAPIRRYIRRGFVFRRIWRSLAMMILSWRAI